MVATVEAPTRGNWLFAWSAWNVLISDAALASQQRVASMRGAANWEFAGATAACNAVIEEAMAALFAACAWGTFYEEPDSVTNGTREWSLSPVADWVGDSEYVPLSIAFDGFDAPHITFRNGKIPPEFCQTIASAHPLFAAMMPWVPTPPVPHEATVASWGNATRAEEV